VTPPPRDHVGILNTLGFVVTLAFALPVALLGINLVVSGRTAVGIALCIVAMLMVGLKQYVTTPDDVPTAAAEKTVGAVVKDDEN
jgi:Na+-transporting methylmalonyl-CoA/oxaloacetate decarboxylase gamma subunit